MWQVMVGGWVIVLVCGALLSGQQVKIRGDAGAVAPSQAQPPAPGPADCIVRQLPAPKSDALPLVTAGQLVAVQLDEPAAQLPLGACWWIEAEDGTGGGVYPASADQYCHPPGAPQDKTCVLAGLPALDHGLYRAHVFVGRGSASVRLRVSPSVGGLWAVMLGSFLLWMLVSVTLKGSVERAELTRRKEHLDDRLEASHDDHKLLLAHIRAALEFASEGLRPWWKKGLLHALRAFAVSERPQVEQHLLEAEQLLVLSERKTELWDRLDAHLYPPSVRTRVLTELRLFDDLVLRSAFPLPPEEFKRYELAPLKRAEALLSSVEPKFENELKAALKLAARAAPAGEEETDTKAPAGSPAGTAAARPLLAEVIAREQAKIERLNAIDEEDAPGFYLQADLRLDVLEKLRQAYRASPDHKISESLQACLQEWEAIEVQDSVAEARYRRVYLDILRELEWRPQNKLHGKQFKALSGWCAADNDDPEPPRATAQNVVRVRPYHRRIGDAEKECWPTYKPRVLTLEIHSCTPELRSLEESFLWRRLISVTWKVKAERGDEQDLFIISEDFQGDGRTGSSRTGPSTVAFGKKPGTVFEITPVIRLHTEATLGTEAASGVVCATPFRLAIEKSTREAQARRLEIYQLARLGISLVATIATTVLLIGSWMSEPPPFVYWRAALIPIGIDLTTLTVPAVLDKLRELVRLLKK